MIVAVHTVAGGVVGGFLQNSLLAFLAGVILHFLADAIPHYDNTSNHKWDAKQVIFTTSDFILTFILFIFVLKLPLDFSMLKLPLFWGAFGGFFPDLLDNVPFWHKQFMATRFGQSFHYYHELIHKKQPHWALGLAIQFALIAIFLWLHFVVK